MGPEGTPQRYDDIEVMNRVYPLFSLDTIYMMKNTLEVTFIAVITCTARKESVRSARISISV